MYFLLTKFFRCQNSFFFDGDFHISFFLGKGMSRIRVPGLVDFFRYKAQEYYIMHGLEKSAISVVQGGGDRPSVISVFAFFKKRFFFFFLEKLKELLTANLFSFFLFSRKIYFNLVYFFVFFIFSNLKKFLVFFIFLKILFYFYNSFIFYKVFNRFLKNLFFFKFFFFEFLVLFFEKFKFFEFFFFIFFFKLFFRNFLFKFLISF